MTQQLDLLEVKFDLKFLPSAKVKKNDKIGVHSWTNFYASFSESFVINGLRALQVTENDKILDPYVGSGTTLVAALKLGIPAVGIDLDPFSCLLARSKIAVNASLDDVKSLLKPSTRKTYSSNFHEDAIALFDKKCLSYATTVYKRILKKTGTDYSNVIQTLLADKAGKYDSEVVALTALAIGAASSAKLIKGSNPAWYRKAIEGEKDTFEELFKATQKTYEKMLDDLDELRLEVQRRDILIINEDIRDINSLIEDDSFSIFITSPPYLTRLDYVIKHLPNLLILSGLITINVGDLRRDMMGTSKIIEKKEFSPCWGVIANSILNQIHSHPSYASKSYYVWTYSQYFKIMHDFLIAVENKLCGSARGLLVVQNSFYKDIYIPLSDILCEMINSTGLVSKILRKEQVKFNMKQINSQPNKYINTTELTEDVIFLKK